MPAVWSKIRFSEDALGLSIFRRSSSVAKDSQLLAKIRRLIHNIEGHIYFVIESDFGRELSNNFTLEERRLESCANIREKQLWTGCKLVPSWPCKFNAKIIIIFKVYAYHLKGRQRWKFQRLLVLLLTENYWIHILHFSRHFANT